MEITMTELLDKVKRWSVMDRSTQLTKQPVYVHRIWYKVGSNNDQFAIYDGVGTTGKKFLVMQDLDDRTTQLDIGLLFNNGLYFEDISGNTELIVSYTIISE